MGVDVIIGFMHCKSKSNVVLLSACDGDFVRLRSITSRLESLESSDMSCSIDGVAILCMLISRLLKAHEPWDEPKTQNNAVQCLIENRSKLSNPFCQNTLFKIFVRFLLSKIL